MIDFQFNCPHCKQTLEAPEEMLGQQIECPTCKGAIALPSPQLPAKPQAFQPLKNLGLNKSAASSPIPRQQFLCPQCGTDECKKVSVVYESGTFTGTTVGLGTDFDGDVGIAGGITEKRSLLASRLAPPEEPSGHASFILTMLTVLGIIGLVGGMAAQLIDLIVGLIWGLAVVVLGALAINGMIAHFQEQREFPALRQSWERLWVCLKCGHTWIRN